MMLHRRRKLLQITFNGPAGAGKGTIARGVAQKMNFPYFDIGLFFRSITYLFLSGEVISYAHLQYLIQMDTLSLQWDGNKMIALLRKDEITARLLTEEIALKTAMLSSKEDHLHFLLAVTTVKLSSYTNIVCDGRSAGTKILSGASHKFYVTAQQEIRAQRRYDDLMRLGRKTVSFEKVLSDIIERDTLDSIRKVDPLCIPKDAVVVHTDTVTPSESIAFVCRHLY